jgi:hypothetical protein
MRVVVKDSGFETCWWGFEEVVEKVYRSCMW